MWPNSDPLLFLYSQQMKIKDAIISLHITWTS